MFLRRTAASLATVVLVFSLSACTGSDEPGATPPADDSSPTAATGALTKLDRPNAPFRVSVRALTGVDSKKRAGLKRTIGAPIRAWIDAAYLAPEPGRSAFRTWTVRAARLAHRNAGVTTNLALGRNLTRVIATKQLVGLYLFGTNGHPGGAAARVWFAFLGESADGTLAQTHIRGQVYLTRRAARWRIFGYDLFKTKAR